MDRFDLVLAVGAKKSKQQPREDRHDIRAHKLRQRYTDNNGNDKSKRINDDKKCRL